MSFKSLGLNKSIVKGIHQVGYETPTLIQSKAIPLILERKDVIAQAQTGTGKTAAFMLPILQLLFDRQDAPKGGKKIRALVVTPTRELATQIAENTKLYAAFSNLKSAIVCGGVSIEPQKDILRKGVDILIATPGRLLDLFKQGIVVLDDVETLVLDEADLMLDMGFIDDVKKIENLCPSDKQILLFSATMPHKVVKFGDTLLKNAERITIAKENTVTGAIGELLYFVPKPKKIELCLHLLRNTIKGDIIIFRRTKYGVDKLEKTLVKNNYKAVSLHGDKSQSARQTALRAFKKKEANILIATDLVARGIDINQLDAVINFDLPGTPETYVHRIGRTGRAGNSGNAFSFCSADEKRYVTSIQNLIGYHIPVEEEHPYPLDPKAKPEVHKKKSKYKKGRKSAASKKKKKTLVLSLYLFLALKT